MMRETTMRAFKRWFAIANTIGGRAGVRTGRFSELSGVEPKFKRRANGRLVLNWPKRRELMKELGH